MSNEASRQVIGRICDHLLTLPRCDFATAAKMLPSNGAYFFVEKGETAP